MILRSRCALVIALLFSFLLPPSLANDDSSFDCRITVSGVKFDFTSLAGEHTANQTRSSPPTSTLDLLRFDLCADLKRQEEVPQRDQCASGTRACLTQVNNKDDEGDRIISVIPLMKSSLQDITFKTEEITSPKYISILSNGPEYPHPIHNTPTHQVLNVTILCSPTEASLPIFKSYDGSQVVIEWSSPAGCPTQKEGSGGGSDDPDNDENDQPKDRTKGTGNGLGWFLVVLTFAFASYFGFGAYYNYSTYGARGADLIPHRDFWKEVPYMLSDVVSHLCSSVRPRRSSNRGYIAV